ncbi:unnamed protein product [Linum trigynum]|uniref:Uncharacterized protein n=1 Tax=Linum trigynum TaxID=586398 RepID=A0AAV2EBU6_9ROSI
MGHVDGSLPTPPQLVDDSPNPAYWQGYDRDQYALTWINLSLSEAVLPNVINKATAYEACSVLARIYASGSKYQIRHLTKSLQHLRRGTATIHDYLQGAKATVDQLAALVLRFPTIILPVGSLMDWAKIIAHREAHRGAYGTHNLRRPPLSPAQ